MKKWMALLLILGCSLNLMAEKKTPAEKAKAKTEEMQKDLQLNPDQNKKIYDINLKAYTAIAEYEAKDPGKKLKKKQKNIVQDLREDQFKKILSPAQYKKYKELKQKEKEAEKQKEKELDQLKAGKK